MNGQTVEYEISSATYEWTARLFTLLRKVLAVNLKLHHRDAQIADGDIFLFNHFARFETFIPQYLIYKESGAYCRSIAGREFFAEGDPFSNYLMRVGAVPDDLPDLLPFLAKEILRGRKIVVFPEGGMVKDKRVLDARGSFSVYSRTAEVRRKQHTGAAVLALALEAFKRAVIKSHDAGNARLIDSWAESLELEGGDALLEAARRPTHIVPANITFYPIRVGDNLLRQGAELLNRGLSRRLSEEFLIEGNILLRDTDMDIRLCKPVRVRDCWRWWDRKLLERVTSRLDSLGDAFTLRSNSGRWDRRLLAMRLQRNAMRLRDDYMYRMYMGVTVNLSHLASSLVLGLVDRDQDAIEAGRFQQLLYVAVKRLQSETDVHLHRSLRNPQTYGGLLEGECAGLEQLLRTASKSDLIHHVDGNYRFQPKLRGEHAFDEVRLENVVEVYANEAAPLRGVANSVREALDGADSLGPETLARLRFDDELIGYGWDRRQFSKPRYREINDAETATESGEPFLLMPQKPLSLGVVLVHGANRLVRWVSSFEGIKPFQSNESEHPHINYRQMPVRGLYELTVLVDALKASLAQVLCPVTLIQGSDDPVVVPDSGNRLLEYLAHVPVELNMVDSQRHGIINEDVGDTRAIIVASLHAWARSDGRDQSLS